MESVKKRMDAPISAFGARTISEKFPERADLVAIRLDSVGENIPVRILKRKFCDVLIDSFAGGNFVPLFQKVCG